MQYPQAIYLQVHAPRNVRMDKYERRRTAVEALVASLGYGGTAKVARAIDKAPDYVSRMLSAPGKAGRKRIGEDTWDALVAAYPNELAPTESSRVREPTAPAYASPAAAARGLLSRATPRSRRVLEAIIRAADAGALTDADLDLLGAIARRFQEHP